MWATSFISIFAACLMLFLLTDCEITGWEFVRRRGWRAFSTSVKWAAVSKRDLGFAWVDNRTLRTNGIESKHSSLEICRLWDATCGFHAFHKRSEITILSQTTQTPSGRPSSCLIGSKEIRVEHQILDEGNNLNIDGWLAEAKLQNCLRVVGSCLPCLWSLFEQVLSL